LEADAPVARTAALSNIPRFHETSRAPIKRPMTAKQNLRLSPLRAKEPTLSRGIPVSDATSGLLTVLLCGPMITSVSA